MAHLSSARTEIVNAIVVAFSEHRTMRINVRWVPPLPARRVATGADEPSRQWVVEVVLPKHFPAYLRPEEADALHKLFVKNGIPFWHLTPLFSASQLAFERNRDGITPETI